MFKKMLLNMTKGELAQVKKDLGEALTELVELRAQRRQLKETIEDLKLQKRLETEEIKHNLRLAEEANKCTLEQTKVSLEKQKAEDISKFKEEQRVVLVESLKEFHSKIESRFNDELRNMKDIYNMLTEKLPNVNFAFTKDLDGKAPRKSKAIEARKE